MDQLFDPLTLRSVTLRNRLAVSPMCQYEALDGFATDYHLVHYGKFALGGFGLVMIEATAVSPEGRITHGDLGLWDDAQIEGLASIAAFLKKHNISGYRFTDFFNLLKVDGQWTVVSKIYHTHPSA